MKGVHTRRANYAAHEGLREPQVSRGRGSAATTGLASGGTTSRLLPVMCAAGVITLMWLAAYAPADDVDTDSSGQARARHRYVKSEDHQSMSAFDALRRAHMARQASNTSQDSEDVHVDSQDAQDPAVQRSKLYAAPVNYTHLGFAQFERVPSSLASASETHRELAELVLEKIRQRTLYPMRKISARELLQSPFAARIIVSEKSRVIYCPVPKAANSNWKMLLRKFEGHVDYSDLATAHSHGRSGFRYLSSFSEREVKALMMDPSYLKMTFVRNPLNRVLSCYLNKFASKDRNSEEYSVYLGQLYGWRYLAQHTYREEPKPSFEEFVNAISMQGPEAHNEHWALMTYICGLGVFPYDFVGRFENMTTESEWVLSAIGRPEEHFPSQSEIKFAASNAKDKLLHYYNPLIEERVRRIYAPDFALLGYD